LLNADGTAWSSFWFETAFNPSIILDDDLNTIEINQKGRELLSDNRGLFLRGATLSAKDRKAGIQLERFVSGLAPGEVNAMAVLDFLILGKRLIEDGPVALQFRDLRNPFEIGCADLEPVFGVTPAEQRTLVLMLQGSSVTEIAAELEKSVLTVRTHVKRLYAKLSVQSREQLFARVGPFVFLSRAFLLLVGVTLLY
jgi:DNA-binding CsgD family transcriptional regulator